MEGRPSSSVGSRCELHPHDDNNNGIFCPSCLRDRLSGLDLDNDNDTDTHPVSSHLHSHHHHHHHHLRRCSSFSFSSRPHPTTSPTIKPIKMHILDLHSHSNSKSKSKSNSNFWITKYWHHWRHPKSKSNSDAHPRFSIHHAHAPSSAATAARASFDCPLPPRFSFDAPRRPSCDPPSASSHCFHPHLLNDHHIPVQLQHEHHDSAIPGSPSQTRDYYLHSSTSNRHRRSFERSVSLRKMPLLPHMDTDHRSVPAFNSKVSPAGNAEFYHYRPSVAVTAVANRDDIAMSGNFSSAFQFQDPCNSQAAPGKRHKKWTKGWNLWGLIQRKGNSKDQPANAAVASGHTNHFLRCNSSISARASFSSYSAAGTGSMRRNSIDTININSRANSNKRRDEFVLERNHSARFSPGRVDNGMLRLYLTPTRGSQSGRRNSGVRPVNTGSQSMSSRHVHRFY